MRHSPFVVCVVVGLLAPLLDGATAQPADTPASASATNVSTTDADSSDEQELITLNFPGGSFADFAQALEKACGRPVNLVLTQHHGVSVPAIQVEDASIRQIMRALSLSDRRLAVEELQAGKDQLGGIRSVWVVRNDPAFSLPEDPQVHVRNYSVESLLAKYNIHDVTTALKTAWEMSRATPSSEPEPELKFHEETKLLILRGTRSQLELAWNVFDELSKTIARPPTEKRSPEEIVALRASLLDLKATAMSLDADLEELRKTFPEEHPQVKAVVARRHALDLRIAATEAQLNPNPK